MMKLDMADCQYIVRGRDMNGYNIIGSTSELLTRSYRQICFMPE